MERHIIVEGAVNVRDLGGYPTADGRVTKHGRLIRSANLDQITPAGQQTLLDYGVKTDVDLRYDSELEEAPDVFAHDTRIRYLHLPFALEDFVMGSAAVSMGEIYRGALRAHRANVATVIGAIADSEPGILFHCAVGKDRTGMISALLLGLVGVPTEVIVEDYAETTQHIAHLVSQWREFSLRNGQNMAEFDRDVSADAATMLATMDALDTDHGGAEMYLRAGGVSDAQLARLRALLLE